MVREFARLSFENCLVSKKDMDLIEVNSIAKDCFEKCTSELNQMASSKLGFYSFLFVLKPSKNLKKLAHLFKNEKIVTMFEENLDRFLYYKDDLQRIFDEAIQLRDELIDTETRLYSIFGDHLPDIVIRKLTNDLKVEDLPIN